MDVFSSLEFRLLRFSARFGSKKTSSRRDNSTHEVVSLVDQWMARGSFADESLVLIDSDQRYEEMYPIILGLLRGLDWRLLSEEDEFRFLTALYAKAGKHDDVTAYYAICRWMDDVGEDSCFYSEKFVGDKLGVDKLYGSYFATCPDTGFDFVPGVTDPSKENWAKMKDARPRVVFSQWLDQHPDDFEKYCPIDLRKITSLL